MESSRLDRRQLRKRAESDYEATPAPRRPGTAARVSAEPEETLVADPRGGLTPRQMVDDKLRALLGGGPRSLHRGDRPEDVRRIGAN